jgi:hypothetical protein
LGTNFQADDQENYRPELAPEGPCGNRIYLSL